MVIAIDIPQGVHSDEQRSELGPHLRRRIPGTSKWGASMLHRVGADSRPRVELMSTEPARQADFDEGWLFVVGH